MLRYDRPLSTLLARSDGIGGMTGMGHVRPQLLVESWPDEGYYPEESEG